MRLFDMSGMDLDLLKEKLGITIYTLDAWYFDDEICARTLKDHFHVGALEGLGLADYDCGVIAAGALLKYLLETQKTGSVPYHRAYGVRQRKIYAAGQFHTQKSGALRDSPGKAEKGDRFSGVLDKTRTAMGARTLRKYIEQPLIRKKDIEERLDAVAELKDQAISREEIREYLSSVYDLERLMCKITYQSANPRDLIAFERSLSMLPHIRCILQDMSSTLLKELYQELDPLEDLCALIQKAIVDDPPIAMKEGGIIKDGYHEEVDRLRTAKSKGKEWLARLEEQEREKNRDQKLKDPLQQSVRILSGGYQFL